MITITAESEITADEIAKGLKFLSRSERLNFLEEFLGALDDASYQIVEQFVKDNPSKDKT